MKVIRLILLLSIILAVVYGLLVFTQPKTANSIDETLGVGGFSNMIRGGKEMMDSTVTDIPSLDEAKKGVVDITGKIQTSIDTGKQAIDTTKETIDTVREGAQKVEEGYNQAKGAYESVQETLSGAADQIQNMQDTMNSLQEITNFNN